MASYDIFKSQNQLRLQNIGCDMLIEIGTKSFPAHRLALMARVEYFRNMFTADMREKKELTVQFDPLIIDPDFFDDLLGYVYTSKIDFTDENIRAIYKAADFFCFDELTTKAKRYMVNTLKLENVVLYRNISVELNWEDFKDKCEQFIIKHLSSDVIKSQLIPALSFEELQSYLEKLKEKRMFEEMFNYSVEWILHEEANRTGRLFELLKNIPINSLPFSFLKCASNNELVQRDIDCLKLLLNTIITIFEPLHSSNISRENESGMSRLYAIGGCGGANFEILSSVSEYNSATRKWTATTPMPSPRTDFACAVIGRQIYVCGGWNGERNINELTVFDTLTRTWTQLTSMKHARSDCSAAVLNGQIYVTGGWDDTCDNRVTVVERYCAATDRWFDVAPMTTERTGHELVALNRFLYVIGGHNGRDALKSVERYDPLTNQWTRMKNTNKKYQSFGSAVLNGYIYISGDDTCGVYSPADDKWTKIPAPSKCDGGRRLAVHDGKLYSIGGQVIGGDLKGTKTVELFDFHARVWRPEPDMDVARYYHGVAVVKSTNFMSNYKRPAEDDQNDDRDSNSQSTKRTKLE